MSMIWRMPLLYLLQNYDAEPIVNIGWGEDVTIRELAELVLSVIGYTGPTPFSILRSRMARLANFSTSRA